MGIRKSVGKNKKTHRTAARAGAQREETMRKATRAKPRTKTR
jgi:hypothetical protein